MHFEWIILVKYTRIYADFVVQFVSGAASQLEHKQVQPNDLKSQLNGIDGSHNDPLQSATPIPGTVPTQPSNITHSENGLPIAVTAEEVKERCPPKAMVKPQVLTHVIEDFVIQESSEPFPVRPGLLADYKNTHAGYKDCDEPPRMFFFSFLFVELKGNVCCYVCR